MRVELSEATVQEYADLYQEGKDLPPIRVIYDGSNYWLYDGFTRWHARRRAGLATIPCEITEGTQRDAVLLACGANAEHGLKRSNADKRKAVETLLADKQWGKKSQRWIADMCAVSETYVRKIISESGANVRTSDAVEGTDGKVYPAKKKPSQTPAQQQVKDFFSGNSDGKREPEPEKVKQHNVSFDVEEIEAQPASIIAGATGREVPEFLVPDQQGAAQLIAAGTQVEKLRTTIEGLSGQRGSQFLEDEIALMLDTLGEIKDTLRASAFFSECPRCKSEHVKCDLCLDHRFIPRALSGVLTQSEQEWLATK
jgi:ParB-like chromosome segregation protein Spo0J